MSAQLQVVGRARVFDGVDGATNQILGRKSQDMAESPIYSHRKLFLFVWRKSMWQRELSAAPFDRDLELAVIDGSGERALLFPCRRVVGGWIKVATERRIKFHPTHWRIWAKEA